MEKEPQPKWVIRKATLDDVEPIRRMQAQSWIETYRNDELGVTEEWLKAKTSGWLTPEKLAESRLFLGKCFADPEQFYRVATLDNQVAGFIHCITKDDDTKRLDGFYTKKEAHGTGMAHEMMGLADEWFGESEVDLEVASYNERAKAFYRKWGFVEVPGSEALFADKIPEVKMVRKRDKK